MLNKELFVGFIFLFFLCQNKSAQTSYTQRVVTYNLLNYEGINDDDNDREDDLRLVLKDISPDVLMVQEIRNETGYTKFLSDILNHDNIAEYEGAPFINQAETDQDIALYFRRGEYEVISHGMVDVTSDIGHRDIPEFLIRHVQSGRKLSLFGVHLKAGNDENSITARLSEASNLRAYLNTLDEGSHFLVMGDFNIYDGNGNDFQRLVESNNNNNNGRLFDPINQIGLWHNNLFYADIHTQSTRAFYDGWNYGGMDDRFDLILTSEAVRMTSQINYVNDSYRAFGNDGNRCCNDPINSGANGVVSKEISDALFKSSDHLPVVIELEFIDMDVSTDENNPFLITFNANLGQNYPNPFNSSTVIPFSIGLESQVSLFIANLSGRVIEKLVSERKAPGFYEVNWQTKSIRTGLYICTLQIGKNSFSKKLLLIK